MRAETEIFRAYDIRGIVPDQLDEAGAEQVGRAFAAYLQPKQVVVGRDVRTTGAAFQAAVIKGLTASGVDVLDIGRVSTDQYYFACSRHAAPGIMVTASHNPPEYNGFKMVRKMPELVPVKEFRSWVLEKRYEDAAKPGAVTTEDTLDAFVGRMLELIPPARLKPLKVVVDTSSGSQGAAWEKLRERLPLEIVPLFWEPDGTFPGHPNDVIQPEAKEPLRKKVLEEKADLGLIFDPDGDRCLAVDDEGRDIPGDYLTALLAKTMLKHAPASTVVYDIRASDAVPDAIREAGGTPLAWKVGHTHIKPKMMEHDAVFGGEVSGHFYFRDFGYADCGILAGLVILEYVSGLPGPLSDERKRLESSYSLSGELNSKVADVPAVLARIKERYADGKIDELDGIAVRYPDWHFVVRPSNTEPVIRLTLEAASRKLMERKRDEVLALIRQ
ncbi:MAG: phosphomannomutase/phosphoglucomutase [Patescibacteria group bacterium]